MKDDKILDLRFTALVNAPIEGVDIATWYFSLSDDDFQSISSSHIALGSARSPDGRRMSIIVEKIGENLLIQHYVETCRQRERLGFESVSDVFTPTGRTTSHVAWELTVKKIDVARCELTNHVRWYATERMRAFFTQRGVSFDRFRKQVQFDSIERLQVLTDSFAACIERAVERNRYVTVC